MDVRYRPQPPTLPGTAMPTGGPPVEGGAADEVTADAAGARRTGKRKAEEHDARGAEAASAASPFTAVPAERGMLRARIGNPLPGPDAAGPGEGAAAGLQASGLRLLDPPALQSGAAPREGPPGPVSPVEQAGDSDALSASAHSPAADAIPRDIQRLEVLTGGVASLGAAGIEPVDALPAGTRVVADVDTDSLHVHVVEAAGEGIGTHGVATCYAVAARGLDGEGRTVLALGHYSSLSTPADAMHDIAQGMAQEGVHDFDVFVVGGQVSLYLGDDPRMETGCLQTGLAFMIAAGTRLAAARIGLSETELAEQDEPEMFAPSTGRPEAVSVVITADGVYHAPYDGADGALFQVDVGEGGADEADDVSAQEQPATPVQHRSHDEPASPDVLDPGNDPR